MREKLDIARPLPEPSYDTARHFEAAAAGRLEVPRCEACKTFIWYPQGICSSCLSDDVRWQELTGVGTIFTYTLVGRAVHPWFGDKLPYPIALVEFDDAPGIRLLGDVQGDPEAVRIGLPVRAVFETVEPGLGVVHFEII